MTGRDDDVWWRAHGSSMVGAIGKGNMGRVLGCSDDGCFLTREKFFNDSFAATIKIQYYSCQVVFVRGTRAMLDVIHLDITIFSLTLAKASSKGPTISSGEERIKKTKS